MTFQTVFLSKGDVRLYKNQSAAGAGGLGIIRGKKVGETEGIKLMLKSHCKNNNEKK